MKNFIMYKVNESMVVRYNPFNKVYDFDLFKKEGTNWYLTKSSDKLSELLNEPRIGKLLNPHYSHELYIIKALNRTIKEP